MESNWNELALNLIAHGFFFIQAPSSMMDKFI